MDIKKRIIKANSKDKSIAGNAWYSNYVARPISLLITKPFVKLYPEVICFIMVLIGLASLPFFLKGTYLSIIIGAVILQIHYIFDHIDGNVARLRNKKTLSGKYLDFIPNISVNPLVLICLGIGLFRNSGNFNLLYLGISAGFFFLAAEPARLFKYLILYEKNIKRKGSSSIGSNIIARVYENFLDYPGIMNLILIFAIFGATRYLIIFYGIIMPILFVLRVSKEFFSWKKQGKINNQ